MTRFLRRCARALLACAALPLASAQAGLPTPNQPPTIAIPATPAVTEPYRSVVLPVTLADPDAGSTALTLTLTILSEATRPAANVGRFTWNRAPVAVTTDTETLTLTQLNQALSTLRFESIAGFAGRARLRIQIDDNAATSPSGVASTIASIDVCGAGETTLADCQANSAPINSLGPTRLLLPNQPSTVSTSVQDRDVGDGTMQIEINLADHPGPGEPENPPMPVAQIGSFSFHSVQGLTSDALVARKAEINQGLSDLQFHPHPDFVGTARLVYEIDDRGNSRFIDTGSPDDILADTDFLILRVCGRDEHGDNVRCLRNDPPVFDLPGRPRTDPRTAITLDLGVDDPDVGGRNLDLSIGVSDADGVLGAASVGRFTWPFGTNVTVDTLSTTLEGLNTGLSNVIFTPAIGFAGTARLTLVVDDNGGTGSGGVKTTTATFDIDVCSAAEVGLAACRVNDAPTVTLAFLDEGIGGVPMPGDGSVSDIDAGAALMNLALEVTDDAGVLAPAQVGTLAWPLGSSATLLTATNTRTTLDQAMRSLVFAPNANFVGRARIRGTLSDLGNSGSGGVRTSTTTESIDIGATADIVRYVGTCLVPAAEGSVVQLRFEREGGQGDARIDFTAGGGSATAGADYPSNLPLSLFWSNGQTGARTLLVPITADALDERTEDFFLEAGPPPGLVLAAPPLIGITIRSSLGAEFIFGDGAEGDCLFN